MGDVFVSGMGDRGSTKLRRLTSIVRDFDPVIAGDVDMIVPEAVIFFLLSSFMESGRSAWLGWSDEESRNRFSQVSGPELEVAREAGEFV